MKSNTTGLWKKSANVKHRQCWCGCRYLWLAIAKAVSRWTTEAVFDAAKTRNASWRQLSASVVWASPGVVRRDKLTVGIRFHTRTTHTQSHPWCLCIAFPRSAVMPPARIWLIRSSWVARRRRACRLLSAQYWARLLRKVLGQYQYYPILASIGQYPIPQYRYSSNPNDDCLDVRREDNQNCSVLCCVWQLCTVIHTREQFLNLDVGLGCFGLSFWGSLC